MTTIRPATVADRAQLANALASAFSEDPLFSWIAGADTGARLEPKMRLMLAALLKANLPKPDHLIFLDEDGIGGAVWQQPNRWKMPTGDLLRSMPSMLRAFGMRMPKMIGALTAIEKVHPKEEHYYLEVLGTRRDMQSKGVGSAVLSHMLERCDAEGMPAYLESSNVRNVPFYARHGFVTTGEIDCGKGAPTVTAMWREPKG
jgi:GNAT superfamily N-acetyltransferase